MLKKNDVRLTADETVELAEMLHIMGDANRLSILLACLDDEQSVGSLAAGLGLTQSLVSHHLRLLRAARLVKGRRQGKQVFYTAADVHVRSVLHDLIAHVIEPKGHHEDD
jgi:DNA-binding transcriptional ArsR family regulator